MHWSWLSTAQVWCDLYPAVICMTAAVWTRPSIHRQLSTEMMSRWGHMLAWMRLSAKNTSICVVCFSLLHIRDSVGKKIPNFSSWSYDKTGWHMISHAAYKFNVPLLEYQHFSFAFVMPLPTQQMGRRHYVFGLFILLCMHALVCASLSMHRHSPASLLSTSSVEMKVLSIMSSRV